MSAATLKPISHGDELVKLRISPGIMEAETGLVLPVRITFKEIGMIAALVVIGCGLAAIPSMMVYREKVSSLLRA